MNCTKCGGLGWLCESHPEQEQGHEIGFSLVSCTGAGMPCDCEAFPHKPVSKVEAVPLHTPRVGDESPPRKFWLLKNDVCDGYVVCLTNPYPPAPHGIHVREVVEVSEAEIADEAYLTYRHDWAQGIDQNARFRCGFEAGARWMKEKLTGDGE